MVEFRGRLIAGNRLTVPVEIRWRFKLEPGEIYLVRLRFADWGSEEFCARLQRGGQITVPIGIVESEGLEKGDVMQVRIHVRNNNFQ
jgi:bifunctional DNA-binding transcriptional regulator/antitoxin component of YhaV-PrlF toxin-antitoxin module